MITANGKNIIKRFHARQIGQIGGSLAFGVGSTAPTVNDTRLGYEVLRVPIQSVNVDPASDRIVFRVELQPRQIKTIYEVGLWSGQFVGLEGLRISNGEGLPVTWNNGTVTNQNARAYSNTIQINYVANGTTNADLSGFAVDASQFTDIDSLVVGYYATVNLSSVRVRLGTDSSNYYEFVLPAPIANSYNVARVTRSAATKVGSPAWNNLTYMAVRPSATGAGSGSIFFDGMRFEPNNMAEANLLVARSVLSTPHSPDVDIVSDVEYSLRINIT